MKRKTFIAIFAAAAAICACEQIDIQKYDDLTSDRYLYFNADTSYVSFMTYGGADVVEYPVILQASGFSEAAQKYGIKVSKSGTTASDSDFELPSSFEFAPKAVKDTFFLKLKYSDKFDTDTLTIALDIVENEVFKLGPSNRVHRVLHVHNAIVKPDWWTSSVTSYYLGTYSDLKYKTLLKVIGHDLDGCTNAEIRYYALIFKQWLADQAAAGNTVKEANGTAMTVAVGQ